MDAMRRIVENVLGALALVVTALMLSQLGADPGGPNVALLGALVGATVGKLAGKAAGWIGKQIGGKATRSAATNTLLPAIGGTVLGAALPAGFNPFAGPVLTQQGSPVQPREGIVGRTISRILPGGMVGNEWQPATELATKTGQVLAYWPAKREVLWSPPGYVIVDYNGQKVSMLKSVAIRTGLYQPAPKPPISGYDARAIRRAAAATKRVKKLAQKVGFTCKARAGRC